MNNQEFFETLGLAPRQIKSIEVLRLMELLTTEFGSLEFINTQNCNCEFNVIVYGGGASHGVSNIFGCGCLISEAVMHLALAEEIFNEENQSYVEKLREIFANSSKLGCEND